MKLTRAILLTFLVLLPAPIQAIVMVQYPVIVLSAPADTACGNMLMESGSAVLMESGDHVLFECSSLPDNLMKENSTDHILLENSNNLHSEH